MITLVFAFLPYPVTLGILVASMVVAVVLSAVLELRTPPRRQVPTGRVDPLDLHHGARNPAVGLTVDPPPGDHGPAVEPSAAGGAGGAGGAVLMLGAVGSAPDSWVELGPLGIDAEIAGVLFAAYVVSQGSEWSRVTGWVRASGDPPSLGGMSSSERFRGKPSKVRLLLECSDDSRNWVTVDERTDIALAVDRRAPRDTVLVGLVHWWRLSVNATAALAAHEVSSVRFAISAVERALGGNPLAGRIQGVTEACRVAEVAGVGLVAHLVPAGRIGSAAITDRRDAAPLEDRIAG